MNPKNEGQGLAVREEEESAAKPHLAKPHHPGGPYDVVLLARNG